MSQEQTDRDTMSFVIRALQSSGVPFHEEPKMFTTLAGSWIEFTTYPEGTYRVDVCRKDAPRPPIAHYLDSEMEGLIIAGLRCLVGTWTDPSPTEDERAKIIDYIGALNSDTFLMETATPRPTPYTPLLNHPICEVPSVAAAPPMPRPMPAAEPEIVVPTPDDPKYTQIFDQMLNICEALRDARAYEAAGDLGAAEDTWDKLNPRLDEVFKLLEPEPVVPPKQFHSGWNVPTFEPSVTCAGTWLECFKHLDAVLKERAEDGPPYDAEAQEAREYLWSLAADEKAGWTRNGDEVFWIMELPQ
jgi:hypothetical protein